MLPHTQQALLTSKNSSAGQRCARCFQCMLMVQFRGLITVANHVLLQASAVHMSATPSPSIGFAAAALASRCRCLAAVAGLAVACHQRLAPLLQALPQLRPQHRLLSLQLMLSAASALKRSSLGPLCWSC
jgi:hypothetical protein